MSLFKRIARDIVTPEVTALEVRQINAWLGDASGTILDLGCGWGRHTALMVREGRRIIGVDRHQPFCAEVQAAAVTFWSVHFHNLIDWPGKVDAAYSWQNSMFACTPSETLESLRGVAFVMKPGAKLLLQNTSREPAIKQSGSVATFKDVTQASTWHDERGGYVRCVLASRDESDSFEVQCYTREQMALMLDLGGFALVRWEDDGMNALSLATKR